MQYIILILTILLQILDTLLYLTPGFSIACFSASDYSPKGSKLTET